MKFSIKDFFSKCDQIRSILWDLVTFTEEILMKNFIFCASIVVQIEFNIVNEVNFLHSFGKSLSQTYF